MSENGQDAAAENFAPRLDALMGDTARDLLATIRRLPDAWDKLPEISQKMLIEEVKSQSSYVVRKLFELIAADDRIALDVTLKDFKVNDKNILSLTISVDAQALDKHTVQELLATKLLGQACTMTIGLRQYMGEGDQIKATPDQPDLPLADSLPGGTTIDAETGEVIGPKPAAEARKNPFAEGYTMGRSGGPEAGNPYPSGSIDRQEWLSGFEKGHEDLSAALEQKLKEQTGALAPRQRGPRFRPRTSPGR